LIPDTPGEYDGQVGTRSNAQLETQLLAEWLSTLPFGFASKTHVRVGSQTLVYQGVRLPPARARAFEVWSDWCDARVVTPGEIWIVEAKIVGVACAYGQVLDYAQQYPESEDYMLFRGMAIQPVVLCAFEKPRTRNYFAGFGVRTIVHTPSWSGKTLASKIYGSLENL
jgi:hypothetical protein